MVLFLSVQCLDNGKGDDEGDFLAKDSIGASAACELPEFC